jgi:hypothetical protein
MAYLYPEDVDQRLNWPLGRAERLARQRRLPYVLLPDGSIRFRWGEIERLVLPVGPSNTPVSHADDWPGGAA